MDKLKIRMKGRIDQRGCEYYFSTTKVPLSVDLTNSVLLFFPDENPENPEDIGGDLVIKKHDRKHSSSTDEDTDDKEGGPRRVRRKRPSRTTS